MRYSRKQKHRAGNLIESNDNVEKRSKIERWHSPNRTIKSMLKDMVESEHKKEKWDRFIKFFTLIASFFLIVVGSWQLYLTKAYQEWQQKEMSRKPELRLELVDDSAKVHGDTLKFSCYLTNSGNKIARFVQIRMNLRYKAGEVLSKNMKIWAKDASTYTIFRSERIPTAKLMVHAIQEVIYYSDEKGQPIRVNLPWVWSMFEVPSNSAKLKVAYFIDTDEEVFSDTLVIDNRFFEGRAIGGELGKEVHIRLDSRSEERNEDTLWNPGFLRR